MPDAPADPRTRLRKLTDEFAGLAWSIHQLAHDQAVAEEPHLCPHTVKRLAHGIAEAADDLLQLSAELPAPDDWQKGYDLGFADACRSIRAALGGPNPSPVSARAMNEMRETLDAIRAAAAPEAPDLEPNAA